MTMEKGMEMLKVEEGPRARVGRSPLGARTDRKENLPENCRKEHVLWTSDCSPVRSIWVGLLAHRTVR